jgi:hypothetical protein
MINEIKNYKLELTLLKKTQNIEHKNEYNKTNEQIKRSNNWYVFRSNDQLNNHM